MSLQFGVYGIVDVGPKIPASRALEVTEQLLAGGVRTVQLRAKFLSARDLLSLARTLAPIVREAGGVFLVNDRADVAGRAGADGVHLGQDDLPAAEVRRWLPPDFVVGVSCHNLHQVERAVADPAVSYIGFGPLFATTSKTDPSPVVGLAGLEAVRERWPALTVVAIGGIGLDDVAAVAQAGADGVAMISALVHAEDVTGAAQKAVAAFQANRRETPS